MGLSGLASRAAELPRFGPKTARSGPNAATRLLGTEGAAGESRDGRPGRPHSTWPGHYTPPFKGTGSNPTYAGKWVAKLAEE